MEKAEDGGVVIHQFELPYPSIRIAPSLEYGKIRRKKIVNLFEQYPNARLYVNNKHEPQLKKVIWLW